MFQCINVKYCDAEKPCKKGVLRTPSLHGQMNLKQCNDSGIVQLCAIIYGKCEWATMCGNVNVQACALMWWECSNVQMRVVELCKRGH